MFIGFEATPSIEGSDGKRQPSQDVIHHTMHDLLEMADRVSIKNTVLIGRNQ